jgi:hypothetical protein
MSFRGGGRGALSIPFEVFLKGYPFLKASSRGLVVKAEDS